MVSGGGWRESCWSWVTLLAPPSSFFSLAPTRQLRLVRANVPDLGDVGAIFDRVLARCWVVVNVLVQCVPAAATFPVALLQRTLHTYARAWSGARATGTVLLLLLWCCCRRFCCSASQGVQHRPRARLGPDEGVQSCDATPSRSLEEFVPLSVSLFVCLAFVCCCPVLSACTHCRGARSWPSAFLRLICSRACPPQLWARRALILV